MCGIAGLRGVGDLSPIHAMCARLAHRGPDDDGFFVDPRREVALGMRRLRVIDLKTGQQPVFNEDRSIVVVYNGEIYNYRELRAGLIRRGHRLATESDTEVIVHLYEDRGEDCVRELDGMFAFALWDANTRKLLLARDAVGIKPLYYWQQGEALAFASELPALLACPDVPSRIRPSAIHDFLSFMYVPGPGTIYQDIREVEPGHLMAVDPLRSSTRRYWEVGANRVAGADAGSRDAMAEALLEHASRAVKAQLVSDVPVGAFLSGGLDSAMVVALMARHASGPVRTFSIGFHDTQFDELDGARAIATRFGTEHHEYRLDPPTADDIVSILGAFGEPFADSSALPTFAVSRMARQQVTVALSGDGGDEVFGGYNNYRADALGAYYRSLPRWMRAILQAAGRSASLEGRDGMSAASKIGRLLRMGEMPPPDAHAWWLAVFGDDMKRELYRDSDSLAEAAQGATRYERVFPSGAGRDFLNDCMAVDFQTVLPFDYLRKADRMSMANSLELRVPLLDRTLVEFAFTLPSHLKVTAGGTKRLLRHAVRNLLPAETVRGRKRGFSIPLSRWLRREWRTLTADVLSPAALRRHALLDPVTVQRYVDDHLAGRRDNGKLVWVVLCLQLWLDQASRAAVREPAAAVL